jgi:uncharacterized Fe-S radical SAM superfamily protein PflX
MRREEKRMIMSEKKEAMFYEKLDGRKVHCYLCPHNCRIPSKGRGLCGVRKNMDGTLYSLNYGEISSVAWIPLKRSPQPVSSGLLHSICRFGGLQSEMPLLSEP